MLSLLARLFLLRRLFGPRHGRRTHQRSPWGYGRTHRTHGYGRSRRSSGGFGMFGPFPTYSRRTRRGSVSVGGCCLPIPLALTAAMVTAGRLLARH